MHLRALGPTSRALVNPFPIDKFSTLQIRKSLQITILNVMKMAESYIYNRLENTLGKIEIALYEQFLLFNSVFNRLVLQTRKNRACLGKG